VSTLAVTRADFQQLADVRLQEAKLLLDAGMWDGAYYLAGYAVEVALKACIIKILMTTYSFFQDKKFSEKCFTHDIEKLVELAGLKSTRDAAAVSDQDLSKNWGVAKDWSEQKRYHRIAETEARERYNAVFDPVHGVLTWIKTQW
jgi:HEPN domain-containing protein